MRRFQFKLQTVLDVKKKREEVLQAELAQLRELYQQQQESLAHLEEKHLFYQAQLQNQREDQLEIKSILAHLEYLKFIAGQISQQEEELSRLTEALEGKRASLVEASQECQLLEGLKERERVGHLLEYRREEQRFLDEVAQLSFVRKEAGLLS